MKNHELATPHRGGWGWYVAVVGDIYLYLHDDGMVKDGTKCNMSSGYFATKQDADAAIAKYYDTREDERG